MGLDRWILLGTLVLLMIYPVGCARPPGGMPRMERPEPGPVTEADYRFYKSGGEPASLSAVVAAAEDVSAVFLGEEHGNPVAHHLQAELLRRLHQRYGDRRPVVLAMEMFERDKQLVVDEYLADLITERHFRRAARPWPGYQTDYRPLVAYAKENGLPVIAGNAPRRYVNRVSRLGREALTDLPAASLAFLPPLPYAAASEAYRTKFREFWDAMAGHGEESDAEPPSKAQETEKTAAFDRFLSAQSLWDAAMADAVAQVLADTPDALVVHVNGKFHSAGGLGIPEHLLGYRPDTRFLTVTLAASESFPAMDAELTGAGDFVAATAPDRSRRPRSPHSR